VTSRISLVRWAAVLVAGTSLAACTGSPDRPAVSTTATAPAAPAPATTIRWTSCGFPAEAGAVVRAISPGGDGLPWTAVGQEGGGAGEVRPAVWQSRDGCAWTRATVRPLTPDGERTGFSAVARRGRVTVAVGRSYSKVHGNPRPTIWRADGVAPLRELYVPRELFGGENGLSMDGLVPGPDALLATGAYLVRDASAGATTDAEDKSVAVVMWRSDNGADWARLAPDAGQVSSAAEQLLPRGMAAGPSGSLVVGTAFEVRGGGRDGFDAAAWVAAGGDQQWRRVDLSRTGLIGAGDQRMVAAAGLGRGYVALAAVRSGSDFQLRSAVSADGSSWSAGGPLPAAAGLPPAQLPAAALATGSTGLVAGATPGGRPGLWRSADGRDWRPEAVPGGSTGPASGVVLRGDGDRLVLVVVPVTGSPRAYLGRPGRVGG
jgi:hypothetical protein